MYVSQYHARPLNQIGFAFEYRFENACLKYKFNLENVKKNSNQIHGETTFYFDSLKSENPDMPDLLGSVIAMMLRLRDFSNILALCKLSAKSKYVCLNELFLNHLTRLLNKLENETRSKNTIGKIQIFCH